MAETVKGMNIKLGLDTTELEANIKSLNAGLKEQQRDLAVINKNLRYDAGNLDLWKQKQDKLNQTLTLTKQKLEEQNKQLEKAKRAVEIGAMSEKEFNKLNRSIKYTEAEVANLNSQLEKTESKIKSLSSINTAAIGKIGSALTKYVTAPAIAAGSALSALALSTAKTVDDIADTAKKLGLSVEALQEWQYTAKLLGSTTIAMDKAFIKVNTILGNIASGNADRAREALALIGLTVDDIAGLNTEEAFEVIRNALASVEDQATRTAVANAFFGENIGSELAPVLEASATEISKWKEEARELGIVTSEDAEIAGSFNDALDSLALATRSLAMSFATLLLPVLEKIVVALRDKLIPSVQKVLDWWKSLNSSVKVIIGVVAGFLIALGPSLVVFSKLVPILTSVKTAFTAVSGAVKVAGLAVKFSTLGWAALIAVIAVVLLQNEKFRALLKRLIDIVGDLLKRVAGFASTLVQSLMPIIVAVMSVINTLIDVVVSLLDDVLDLVIDIIDVIINLIEALIPVITKIINKVVGLLIPIINAVLVLLNPIVKIIKILIGLIVKIAQVAFTLINSVIGPLIKVITVVADILNIIIKLVVSLLDIAVQILNPILQIIVALLIPIIEVISVIIEVISVLMVLLEPLINVLLAPLLVMLEVIFTIIEALTPVLLVLSNVIKAVIVPVLEILFVILEPILAVLTEIIDGVKWLLDKASGVFNWFAELFNGEAFTDTNAVKNNSVTNNKVENKTTTNNVTINTTGDVDIDSINAALGGAY